MSAGKRPELEELKKAQWWAKAGLRGVQQVAKGRKQLDLWKIHYTESKVVKMSSVDLAPAHGERWRVAGYRRGSFPGLCVLKCYTKRQGRQPGPLQFRKKVGWFLGQQRF
jgi:hypothetical protein